MRLDEIKDLTLIYIISPLIDLGVSYSIFIVHVFTQLMSHNYLYFIQTVPFCRTDDDWVPLPSPGIAAFY